MWVWSDRKPDYVEKHFMPTIKYGRRCVMLWAWFSIFIFKYQDILNQILVASASSLKLGHHWVFEQRSDLRQIKHRKRLVHLSSPAVPIIVEGAETSWISLVNPCIVVFVFLVYLGTSSLQLKGCHAHKNNGK
ncbi:hypothetical protein XENOCAPTIV_003398 [Xenoophorus captivus]|uniref:Uncharacterized protein n=1 Tax=Xenoophorus captivus TaxID=1517983 RepID=A0ABV0S9N9_9TELE